MLPKEFKMSFMSTPEDPNHPAPLTPFFDLNGVPADAPFQVEEHGDIRVISSPQELIEQNVISDLELSVFDELGKEGVRKVIIDFRDLTTADSRLLAHISAVAKAAKKRGQEVIIGGPVIKSVGFLTDSDLALSRYVREVNLLEDGVLNRL